MQLSGTPWTVALQAPLSMGFPRQEYWNGLPFLSPGDLPHSGIEPVSPELTDGFFTAELPGKFILTMKVKVKVTQFSLTLCDPMDYTVHGILQARIYKT